MDYKKIINEHQNEIEDTIESLREGPLQDGISREFKKRNGFVRIRIFEKYLELDGCVHEGYTIYRIVYFEDLGDIRGLAEDLIIADYSRKDTKNGLCNDN